MVSSSPTICAMLRCALAHSDPLAPELDTVFQQARTALLAYSDRHAIQSVPHVLVQTTLRDMDTVPQAWSRKLVILLALYLCPEFVRSHAQPRGRDTLPIFLWRLKQEFDVWFKGAPLDAPSAPPPRRRRRVAASAQPRMAYECGEQFVYQLCRVYLWL